MNETLFIECLDEELATKALALTGLRLEKSNFPHPSIGFSWTVAFQGLLSICFPDGRYQKPRSSMVRKAEAQLLRNFPVDTAGSQCNLVRNDRLKWTVSLIHG